MQNGMSALPPKADINITSRKAAPVAAFQMMWLSTAGQLLRAAIFLAFCHIANLRTAFAVAGICLVFFLASAGVVTSMATAKAASNPANNFIVSPMNVVAQRLVV